MTKVFELALAHEAANSKNYDRFVLVRPDVILLRDLHLERLRPGRPYCTTRRAWKSERVWVAF